MRVAQPRALQTTASLCSRHCRQVRPAGVGRGVRHTTNSPLLRARISAAFIPSLSLLRYVPKAAPSARFARLRQTRAFSSALPDGWEAIRRRNGEVVYYNKDMRKTVRHLPGVSPQEVAPLKPTEPESKKDESLETAATTLPHHESTGNEVFVPINFATAMSVEGHDSQVVHIELEPEQCLRAETGAMIYMTEGVEMETTTAGGLGEGMKRMMTGENFFVSRFTYHGGGVMSLFNS
ncbi:hypothetical protein PF008_g2308 [Phytophthora fragariae]|uniref:WW domain-containing protein n=1 Tax=Phytophthora fragariae TaxID=53985 RepID=A0A6G0SHT4_9STRA|nr:hypothetical protein PF008_g2308 [Phytophthora fragariae]